MVTFRTLAQREPSGGRSKDSQKVLPSDNGSRNIPFVSSVVWQWREAGGDDGCGV